jgi:hypothetical protein
MEYKMTSFLVFLLAVSGHVQQWENPPPNGWKLRVEPEDAKLWLLPGEDLGRFRVKLTLVNLSAEVRPYVPLRESRKGGVLELDAVQNGRIAPRQSPFPPFPPSRIGRPALGPGEVTEMTIGLWHFGYKRLDDAGKIEVKARLETDDGPVVSKPFSITVLDIAPRDIKLSKFVPLTERATRTDGTEPRVVIELVELREDRWLIYRRFHGPKYGGGIAFTERLAPAKGVTDFVVSGSFGDDEPLAVAFHDAEGKRTELVVDSYFGRVLKKQVKSK